MQKVNIACKKEVKNVKSVRMMTLNGVKYVKLVTNYQITVKIATKYTKNINIIFNI